MMNMAGLLACLCVTFPFTIVNSGLRKHDPKKKDDLQLREQLLHFTKFPFNDTKCTNQNSTQK
jgi:hypothetical protein